MSDVQSDQTAVFEISIQRERLQKYMFARWVLWLVVISVFTFGIGLIFLLVFVAWYGSWWTKRWVQVVSYRVEGSVLHVQEGVFFKKLKAIPLERITDLVIAEGPLCRRHGITILSVQTAGAGQQCPEAALCAVESPQEVREMILIARRSGVAPA